MSDTYLQDLFAERIGGKQYGKSTEIYKFEKIKRAKRAALAANPGAELIDMGVGEPDEPAPRPCIDALYEARARTIVLAAGEPETLYPAGDGAFEFERTASRLQEMRSADWLVER